MEKELDLTLRLRPPSPTVDTHPSMRTPTTDQGIIVVDDGGHQDNNDGVEIHGHNRHVLWNGDEVIDNDEGARNNVNVNIRVYSLIFNHFAGIGETLNFSPYPMPPSSSLSPAPAPETPAGNDYVRIDVPARRAHRNSSLAFENAQDANVDQRRRRGCGGCCGGRVDGLRKCTNMNCNAVSTPMWRRGPLGPKSLCNACGIKFRKEQERRTKRNQETA